MRVSLEDGNYPKGSNLDHAASKGLDVMYRMQVLLVLRRREGAKVNTRKTFPHRLTDFAGRIEFGPLGWRWCQLTEERR